MQDLLSGILPGLGEMMNIHPMLVHFPIALLNAFIIMELLGFILKKESMKNAASWMLYLGTLGAVATVTAGFIAASTVPHGGNVHHIMTKHRNLGVTVLSIAVVLSLWRLMVKEQFSKHLQLAHLAIGIIMVTTMAFGADLGGLMVYKYGVAVRAAPQPASHNHSAGDHHHDEIDGHDNGMMDNMDDMEDLKGMTLEDMEKEKKGSHDNHDHGSHQH